MSRCCEEMTTRLKVQFLNPEQTKSQSRIPANLLSFVVWRHQVES